MLNKYQPERTHLLINTDWGISCDRLTADEAQSRGMLLFHDRWVTAEEKKQLQDENNAYRTIRIIGVILILFAISMAVDVGLIAQDFTPGAIPVVIYALAEAVSGIGLIRYKRIARNLTILILVSFFILPFTEQFGDEKGAPFLFVMGVLGLYYLLRKTARKIFASADGAGRHNVRKTGPVVRKVIYGTVLFVGLAAGCFIYDLIQARRMTADACGRAQAGMPLEEYLSKFSVEDYKIIRGSQTITIVPKRGMGRNHCTVGHDGRNITGAKTGFVD